MYYTSERKYISKFNAKKKFTLFFKKKKSYITHFCNWKHFFDIMQNLYRTNVSVLLQRFYDISIFNYDFKEEEEEEEEDEESKERRRENGRSISSCTKHCHTLPELPMSDVRNASIAELFLFTLLKRKQFLDPAFTLDGFIKSIRL